MIIATPTLALATEWVFATLFLPALKLGCRQRTAALVFICTPIALAPLWIPSTAPAIRFLASLNAAVVCLKLFDLHVGAGRGCQPGFRTFLVFLTNFTTMVLRRPEVRPRPGRRQTLLRLSKLLAGLSTSSAVLIWSFVADWSTHSFILEHAIKATAVFFVVTFSMAMLVAIQRATGAMVRDFTNAPLTARSPADFWRRYNLILGQLLYEDVFKLVGGRRSPIRGILVAFLVSALVHEYIFSIAIGQVQGFQTLFFLLQGSAVAATARVKPRGGQAIPWVVGTFAFNLFSSVLFFASCQGLVGFYAGGLPSWLQMW